MKLTSGRVDGFIRAPPAGVNAFLLYGPDSGLVRERAEILAGRFLDDLHDPFRVADLSTAALKEEPGCLADEARALCLTGGRRLIRIQAVGEGAETAFKRYFASTEGDAAVIVEAGELGSRSAIRKLFEGSSAAAALPCYQDDSGRLSVLIIEDLRKQGVAVDGAAVAYLESALGADRALTRRELEKLAVYMGGTGTVGEREARACIGDAGTITLDGVAIAAGDGNFSGLDKCLARAWAEGMAPVAILRAMGRHLAKLHRLSADEPVGDTLKKFRPPLHFTLRDALKRQIRKWPRARVAWAVNAIHAGEIACKRTGAPALALCQRTLMRVASASQWRDSPPDSG